MALNDFLLDLVSEHADDEDDWVSVTRRLRQSTGILWYGGSGLDLLPIVGSSFNAMPVEVIRALGHRPLFIYCDSSVGYFEKLEALYDNLDDYDFPGYSSRTVQLSEKDRAFYEYMSLLRKQETKGRGWTSPKLRVDCEEAIMLRHKTFNREPRGPGHNSPVTPSWRGFYASLDLSVDFDSGFESKPADLLFLNIEVLESWHRLFEQYEVKPDVFLTLRTGGKSGSWMDMRDPAGPLMQAVANTGNATLRPDFWITDQTRGLEQVWDDSYVWLHDEYKLRWRRVFANGRDGYGLPQTFKCDWSLLT